MRPGSRYAIALAAISVVTLLASAASASAGREYFSHRGAGNVSGFTVAPNGSLSDLPGSPFGLGFPFPDDFVPTPDARHGVASDSFSINPASNKLAGYSISPAGAVAAAQSPLPGNEFSWLAVSPDGRFAYASASAAGVAAYAIGADGALTPIGAGAVGPAGTFQSVITPDGKFVFAIGPTTVQRYAVQADGSVSFLGATPVGYAQVDGIAIAPQGGFVFVAADDYPSPGGAVVPFAIGTDGSLTLAGPSGSLGDSPSPYIPVVSPNGRFLYEPDPNLDGVWVFAIAANGGLTAAPTATGTLADTRAAGLTPDGRFIYLADGGTPNHLRGLTLNADGSLGGEVASLTTPGGDTLPAALPAQPPSASFKSTAAAPGSKAKFDAGASSDSDGSIARYDWSFGDGTTLANGGAKPSHAYVKAGKYDVRLTVTDDQGCSTARAWAGFTAYCNGGPSAAAVAKLDTLPAVSRLSITNKRFAVAAARRTKVKRGTAFRYRLTEAAKVTFSIARKTKGRKVGKRCKSRTHKNARRKKCTSFKKAGSFTSSGRSGRNRTRFSGKIHRRKLKPGSYRATAVASDSARGKSKPRRVSFTVVRRPR